MDSSPSTEARLEHAVYCVSCNGCFPSALVSVCPQCGGEARDASSTVLADTMLVKVDRSCSEANGDSPSESDNKDGRRQVTEDRSGHDLGEYRLERLLGEGGMGQVYLARHLSLGRPCALKLLSPKVVDHDVDYIRRFVHEGRSAAGLVHPHVVTVHNIGEHDGAHYLEMEFVAGRTLQQLLIEQGRQTPIRATSLMVEIASGLAAAHREGIVHRDLKADNVLLTYRGQTKIADFGLAKRVLDDDGVPSERIVGTPHYMAPELFLGEPASAASDVYALGVIYYQLLTGRFPFAAPSLVGLRSQVESGTAPSVRTSFPDVPLEMASCVSSLMEKSPANRPADALEALQMLQSVLGAAQAIETLLDEAFDTIPTVEWTRTEQRFEVRLEFPDGRKQMVFLESSGSQPQDQVLMIYSLCCASQEDYFEQALRLNSEIPHGGLAIREENGVPYFVMIDTYPRSTLSAETVRRSVLEVGARADAVEKQLTGLDVH